MEHVYFEKMNFLVNNFCIVCFQWFTLVCEERFLYLFWLCWTFNIIITIIFLCAGFIQYKNIFNAIFSRSFRTDYFLVEGWPWIVRYFQNSLTLKLIAAESAILIWTSSYELWGGYSYSCESAGVKYSSISSVFSGCSGYYSMTASS